MTKLYAHVYHHLSVRLHNVDPNALPIQNAPKLKLVSINIAKIHVQEPVVSGHVVLLIITLPSVHALHHTPEIHSLDAIRYQVHINTWPAKIANHWRKFLIIAIILQLNCLLLHFQPILAYLRLAEHTRNAKFTMIKQSVIVYKDIMDNHQIVDQNVLVTLSVLVN